MELNPYLTFDGNCAEALAFYADVFGGEVIVMQKFGDSPMAEEFSGVADKVMHAQLRLGDQILMASDNAGLEDWSPPKGITLQTAWETLETAQEVFDALAEGGEVTMPFEPTFWAKGFGMVRDRFGMPWMVNCDGEPE